MERDYCELEVLIGEILTGMAFGGVIMVLLKFLWLLLVVGLLLRFSVMIHDARCSHVMTFNVENKRGGCPIQLYHMYIIYARVCFYVWVCVCVFVSVFVSVSVFVCLCLSVCVSLYTVSVSQN